MSTLRIFMLGPIQFRRDEQLIPLRVANYYQRHLAYHAFGQLLRATARFA